MAGVRKRGKRYSAIYTAADGRQRELVLRGVRTLTEARRTAEELERQAFRVRQGLEVAPSVEPLAEVAERYLSTLTSYRSYPSTLSRWRRHVLPALGAKPIGQVTPGDVQKVLDGMRAKRLGQQTRRHVRVTLAAFYEWASRERLVRENPVRLTDAIPVPEAAPKVLDLEVIERVRDAAVTPVMRDLIWWAALTTRRREELLGLRWEDVDLEAGTYRFRKGKTGQKGEASRVVTAPLPAALLPWARRQFSARRGPHVFAHPDGTPLAPSYATAKRFRTALARAGVVDGWELRCRRQGCGFAETVAEKVRRDCPRCGFALWPHALPVDMSFKDLRSSGVTAIIEATGSTRAGQLAADHESEATTRRHYAAKRLDYVRQQLDMAHARLTRASGEPAEEDNASPGAAGLQPGKTREGR